METCKRAETQIFRQTCETRPVADRAAAALAVCFPGATFFLRDKLLEQLKASIASRLHSLLTARYGAAPENSTGQSHYRLSGTRDDFVGAEDWCSLGACRVHSGFPSSVTVQQGWGGVCAASAGTGMLSPHHSEWPGAEYVTAQLMHVGIRKYL